ncbi:hypothetical protein [Streptomyces sp. NPDC001450]
MFQPIDFRHSVCTGPVTGKADHHHYYGARRPAAAWPHQVGVIPPRAGCFQTRAEVVRLREALTGGRAAVLVGQDTAHGQVLAGMGGVGKTQLAADYARTAWQTGELDLLVWITASNATAVASGYAFLNPNGIPETVLTSAPALTHLTRHRAEDGSQATPQNAPWSEGWHGRPAVPGRRRR